MINLIVGAAFLALSWQVLKVGRWTAKAVARQWKIDVKRQDEDEQLERMERNVNAMRQGVITLMEMYLPQRELPKPEPANGAETNGIRFERTPPQREGHAHNQPAGGPRDSPPGGRFGA